MLAELLAFPKEVATRELVRSVSHSNITVVVTMARNHNKRNGGAKGAAETLNYSPTAALFHWVDPVSSGVVLALGLLLLLSLSCYSTISIIANLLLLGVVVGLGSKMYVHLMGMLKKPCKDPLAQLAVVDLSIPEDCEHLAEFVKSCVDTYNTSASTLRSVLLGEDMYGSLKFGLVVYMLTFVGAIFNTLTLLTIGWVLSFILPKVLYKIYEDNQDPIDELYYKVVDQYSALDGKVAALFPAGQVAKVAEPQIVEEKEE